MSIYSKRVQICHTFIFRQYRRPMLCAKQKSIRWSLAPMKTPQAQVPEFRKLQNQYLVLSPFALTVAVHPCLTERKRCRVVMIVRFILRCHNIWHNLSRISDVTKRRSRPCILTIGHYFAGSSCI